MEQVAVTDNAPLFVRLTNLLSTVCGIAAAGMVLISVAITCQMIFVRAILNESTIWQTEAVVYLMITATLLGLPYVQRLRGHVTVDLLPMLLPKSARKILLTITLVSGIVVLSIMLFYGYEMWALAFERNWRSDTVWGVRLWIPYLAVPVGFALYILQMLADLYGVLMGYDMMLSGEQALREADGGDA